MTDAFLHLPIADRREALSVAADWSGRPAHLLEKDVWVVWALARFYGSALGEHLVFKGGTSLSRMSAARRGSSTWASQSLPNSTGRLCL
jgi:hypothetical protein